MPSASDARLEMRVLEMRLADRQARQRRQFGGRQHADAERRHDLGGRVVRAVIGGGAQRAAAERGVDHQHRLLELAGGEPRGDGGERHLLARQRPAAGVVQLALRVVIDLGDGGAGQDVVELVLEHDAPEVLEAFRRLGPEQRRERAERLRRDQRALGLPVRLLHPALRGEGAAVQLEIDVALPDRQPGTARGLVRVGEEILDPAPARRRQRREIAKLHLALDHLRRHPAAAVAIADGEQGLRMLDLAS